MKPAEQQGFGPAEFKDEPDDKGGNNISSTQAKAIAAGLAVTGLFAVGAAVESHVNQNAEAEHQKIEDANIAQSHGIRAMMALRADVQTSGVYDWENEHPGDIAAEKGKVENELPVKENLTKDQLISFIKMLEKYYDQSYTTEMDMARNNKFDWENDPSNPDTLLVRIIDQKTDSDVRATALRTLITRQENGDAVYISNQVKEGKTIEVQVEPPIIVSLLTQYSADTDPTISRIAADALRNHPQWQRGEVK
jgi:hypothetical protein